MPSLSSTDDELQVKKSNKLSLKSSMQQNKLTILKDAGWSPLKCSVIESSDAQITSTPVPQITDQFITDIKSLKSKSKYYHNIGNSNVFSKDDVDAQTNHSNKTSSTTKTVISPQKFVDNSSGLNSTIIAKGDCPHSSLAKRSLFYDLDESPSVSIIDSPIKICTRTLSADNCVIIKTTEKKSSNSKQQKTFHKDEQYAKLLNLMVTMKYELRSIQEKLDIIIIQREEENNLTKTNDLSVYDTGNIDGKLPIQTQEKLEELENNLSNDKNYRYLMVKRLSSVGGRSMKIMVKRIMALIFSPELLCEFSYNGRGNKKRPFQKLLVNKIIFDSVLTIKKFAMTDNASNEIEQVIKYVLVQTPFKIKDQTARKEFA